MAKSREIAAGRRDLLRLMASVGIAAATVTASSSPADAPKTGKGARGKRKSQYQPDSAEVQTFYRVNKYPNKK